MLIVGRRVIPWLLHYVAHTGSRELFRLAVLAIALGVAFGAAELFGVSFALGAFFAGMVLSESELSQRAAKERCRCAMPSRCCSSSRSACCSTRRSGARAAAGARDRAASSWSASRSPPTLIVRAFGHPHDGADHLGEPRADRRILVHPGRPRRELACCRSRARSDPGRGDHLDPAQSAVVRLARPLLAQGRDAAAARDALRRGRAGRASRIPLTTLTGHVVLVGYGRVGSYIGGGCARRHAVPGDRGATRTGRRGRAARGRR